MTLFKREKWKPVKGYESLYFVSNKGAVWSRGRICQSNWVRPPMLLKPFVDAQGYLELVLYDEYGKSKKWKLHRLVIHNFVGPSTKPVNHKNGDKENNCLENLEYCTPSHNSQHAWDTGLIQVTPALRGRGHRAGLLNRKLTLEVANQIRADRKQKRLTLAELSRKYDLCRSSVCLICKYKTYIQEDLHNVI